MKAPDLGRPGAFTLPLSPLLVKVRDADPLWMLALLRGLKASTGEMSKVAAGGRNSGAALQSGVCPRLRLILPRRHLALFGLPVNGACRDA